jgi:ABC-2 type transport system permease protein
MAVEFGLLLGIYARDISTMFAAIKTMGILLYAPAFVYMFPQLPDWIGRIFPTYYVIQPVVAISQQGESWSGVALEVAILILLVLAFGAVVAIKTRAIRERLA